MNDDTAGRVGLRHRDRDPQHHHLRRRLHARAAHTDLVHPLRSRHRAKNSPITRVAINPVTTRAVKFSDASERQRIADRPCVD